MWTTVRETAAKCDKFTFTVFYVPQFDVSWQRQIYSVITSKPSLFQTKGGAIAPLVMFLILQGAPTSFSTHTHALSRFFLSLSFFPPPQVTTCSLESCETTFVLCACDDVCLCLMRSACLLYMHGNLSPFNLLIGNEKANLSSGESLRRKSNTQAHGKADGRMTRCPSQDNNNSTFPESDRLDDWKVHFWIFQWRDKDTLRRKDVRVAWAVSLTCTDLVSIEHFWRLSLNVIHIDGPFILGRHNLPTYIPPNWLVF